MGARKEYQWTCGHVAGAACAECYRELAQKANKLAEDCEAMRDEMGALRLQLTALQGGLFRGEP